MRWINRIQLPVCGKPSPARRLHVKIITFVDWRWLPKRDELHTISIFLGSADVCQFSSIQNWCNTQLIFPLTRVSVFSRSQSLHASSTTRTKLTWRHSCPPGRTHIVKKYRMQLDGDKVNGNKFQVSQYQLSSLKTNWYFLDSWRYSAKSFTPGKIILSNLKAVPATNENFNKFNLLIKNNRNVIFKTIISTEQSDC